MGVQGSVKLKNHIADAMLTNLAHYYGASRLEVVELLVRLMHRVQFGSRMYPELDLNFEGYNDTMLALIMEEAANGGQDAVKVARRMSEIRKHPVVAKAYKDVEQTVMSGIDEDLAVRHRLVDSMDGRKKGVKTKD